MPGRLKLQRCCALSTQCKISGFIDCGGVRVRIDCLESLLALTRRDRPSPGPCARGSEPHCRAGACAISREQVGEGGEGSPCGTTHPRPAGHAAWLSRDATGRGAGGHGGRAGAVPRCRPVSRRGEWGVGGTSGSARRIPGDAQVTGLARVSTGDGAARAGARPESSPPVVSMCPPTQDTCLFVWQEAGLCGCFRS